MSSLLERVLDEIRENNQMLGEILSKLDSLPIETRLETNVKDVGTTTSIPPPDPDMNLLSKVFDTLVSPKYETFWPKCPAPRGWVRVAVQYPDESVLAARVARGCLCGKAIVVKKGKNEEEFFTCEGVTKGGCDHRPSIQVNNLKFLINLPPAPVR